MRSYCFCILCLVLPALALQAETAPQACAVQLAEPALQVATVEGMHCMHCAKSIERSFMSTKKVREVFVDLERKCVAVEPLPGATVSNQLMRDVIDGGGFKIVELESVEQSMEAYKKSLEDERPAS